MIWENVITALTATLHRKQKGNATSHFTGAKNSVTKAKKLCLQHMLSYVWKFVISQSSQKGKKHEGKRDQGRKRKNTEAPYERKTKARTIQDMLRANLMIKIEDDADDSDEDCLPPQ
ncbi:Hypothetical predicted protein [Paramuricea clavata]|uniref:Uncharacterized protein n=1 Tax=Paramuricea clavata TaxID=317549 RepID=A0A7D9HDM5_PARCT|nr:Hypothetical predicted protein [Paramuricea clavata]